MSGKIKEKGMEILFLVCALASIAAVAVICLFLFMGGIPAIGEIGAGEFLLGRKWAPQDVPASFGIFPMILGSVYVTGGAILLGVPVGILAAVFLARFCPRPAYRVLGPAVQLMAGIPSIVYGFFGMVVNRPLHPGAFPEARRGERQQHPGRLDPAGDHDPADGHRRVGIGAARRAAELLRGRARRARP